MTLKPILNYYAGKWEPDTGAETVAVTNPATQEVLGRRRSPDRCRWRWRSRRPRRPCPAGGAPPRRSGCSTSSAENPAGRAHRRAGPPDHPGVRQDASKKSRAEMRRAIENVEVACGIPTTDAGRYLRRHRPGHRRDHAAPAGGGVRHRSAPFNFPGDDPLLVPALRPGLRQHLCRQALRARAADHAARLRADRTARPAAGAWSTWSTAAKQAVDALLDHPAVRAISFVGSTPGRRCTSTAGRRPTASAPSARAAPRTRS